MPMGSLKIVLLGLTILLVADELQADPLNQWTWRFPYPQGYTLDAVAYGDGQFVAVGDNGTIITSPDGYNWINRSYGIFPFLRGVAYADGEYAAVGDGGVIIVSSNAATWTQITSVTSDTLYGIAGNSSWRSNGLPQFLAVGDSGTAVICSNGTSWSVASSGTSNSLYAVVNISSSLYLIVGNAGTVIRFSTTGFHRLPQSYVGTTNNIYAVASAVNGVVAAVGDLNYWVDVPASGGGFDVYYTNGILYSLNSGIRWTNQMWGGLYGLPNVWFPSDTFILHGATFGTNGFVAVGDTGYTLEYMYPGVVFTSTNGTSWFELPNSTSENRLYGCTYGNGLYVLVGDAGTIVVSSNLVNWTEITSYHRSAITAIACNTNLCIASALPIFREYSSFADFTTLVSSNGINWSVSTVNMPAMADLTSGDGRFVGVSQNNICTTADGYNWQNNGSFNNTFHGVRYANGQFIAVGDNGSIFESADGINWNNHSVATSGSFSGVAFGNELYVAAGSVAATSPDGVAWSLCASNPPAVITRIVYGEGLFVATAYVGSYYYPNGEILTSQDGVNWQVQFTPQSISFSGIAYSGGTFFAIGSAGTMFKSTDGTNWINIAFNLPTVDKDAFSIYYNLNNLSLSYLGYYATVCAYNGTFLAAGLDGIMVQSGDTWNRTLINVPQATSNGFAFSYNQQVNVPYHIQSSTNLLTWVNACSGIGSGQPTNFIFTASTNYPAQFFRIVSP